MLRVGLTGGYATGKSFVGRTLEEFGCHVIRADQIGHQLLARGGAAYEAVITEFGTGILNEAGEIDRKRLADVVFPAPERLDSLNRIIHPLVFEEEERLMAEHERNDPAGIAVVEAAILIETGSYRRYDRLIVAVCSEEQQITRAMARDGCTREQAEARLRRQMPVADKMKYADFVIDTSGPKADTVRQTRGVFEALRRMTQ